jgi:MFS family permease
VSGVLGNEALAGGAWLAALPCLVALPAAPFLAFLADAKGRKAGAFCICVFFIVSTVENIDLVLKDQQSVGMRSVRLMDTVNAKKRRTII